MMGVFGPGFNPYATPPPVEPELPTLKELSLEEAVAALMDVAHHESVQVRLEKLGAKGIVLAKR